MKRKILIIVLTLILALAGAAIAMQHGGHGKGCHYCGMNLEKFAHTAMTITYDDGSKVDVCSIHCAAIDMAVNINKSPSGIMVGDFITKQIIDAEKAFWVIDESNPGVMTSRAKWAFSSKKAADNHVDTTCAGVGMVVSFDGALKAAYEDMYSDTQMIRNKRKMMKSKGMGH